MATPPPPFPVPNATIPYWRTELHELDSHQSSDALPEEQDYVIIGAGFTGVATAFYLVEDQEGGAGASPTITILEAREACSGATARNGGHVRPNRHIGFPQRIARWGLEATNELAEFEVANLSAVAELVKIHNIDCDFHPTTSMSAFIGEQLAAQAQKEYDETRAAGCPTAQAPFVNTSYGPVAEEVSKVASARAVFKFEAASIWPYKFVMGLLEMAVKKGVKLYTHTLVNNVSASADPDGKWIVSTPKGSIKAKRVVYASNGYTSTLLPEYSDRIIPVRGVCSHVVAPDPTSLPQLLESASVKHGPNLYDYQITRPDATFIIGGARTVVIPRLEQWYNVYDDSTLIEPAARYFDTVLQRHYRGWESSGARADHVWTGIMGYTNDLMPHVGEVPGRPGQFIAAGFNGHGMAFILLTAKGLAAMLRNGLPFSKTGIPRLFKTSEERLERMVNYILQ